MADTVVSKHTRSMRIGIAADHGGFALKEQLLVMMRGVYGDVVDYGNGVLDASDDYPDFVMPLARALAAGRVHRGIALCGSGVGAGIAANKIEGVRACLIHDVFSARQGVEDDDLNMICLGGRVIGPDVAWELVQTFLAAAFSGAERHRRRLAKVVAYSAHSTACDASISPFTGTLVQASALLDIPALLTAYYAEAPDAHVVTERVVFGTSRHRGTACDRTFKEAHVLAITEAICEFRFEHGTRGSHFLGRDTHALSAPAHATALGVIAAHGVEVRSSATEFVCTTCAESFSDTTHFQQLLSGAHLLVANISGDGSSHHHSQTVPEAKEAWRNEGNPN